MARSVFTGDRQVEKLLKKLADKAGDRVAKSCISAGTSVLRKEIKKAAPKGPTGNLKKSVGSRISGRIGKDYVAKAGINVGKRTAKQTETRTISGQTFEFKGVKRLKGKYAAAMKRSGKSTIAPHAHLVALGTRRRFRSRLGGKFSYITNPTKSQLRTGKMPANPFVKRATRAAKGAIRAAMIKAAHRGLEREAKRAQGG